MLSRFLLNGYEELEDAPLYSDAGKDSEADLVRKEIFACFSYPFFLASGLKKYCVATEGRGVLVLEEEGHQEPLVSRCCP